MCVYTQLRLCVCTVSYNLTVVSCVCTVSYNQNENVFNALNNKNYSRQLFSKFDTGQLENDSKTLLLKSLIY